MPVLESLHRVSKPSEMLWLEPFPDRVRFVWNPDVFDGTSERKRSKVVVNPAPETAHSREAPQHCCRRRLSTLPALPDFPSLKLPYELIAHGSGPFIGTAVLKDSVVEGQEVFEVLPTERFF